MTNIQKKSNRTMHINLFTCKEKEGRDNLNYIKIVVIAVMLIALFSLAAAPCSAFGVSPAKQTKFFDYGKAYIYSFWIINKDYQNISLDISVEGELSKYITILNESIELKETDDFEAVFFRVGYPHLPVQPGSYTAFIVFTESTGQNEIISRRQETNNIKVIPVIKAVFEAFAPYPGTYLEYNMSIESANLRQPAKIIFPLSNKGTEDISDIYADVDILDRAGKPIVLKKTKNVSLKSQKQGELRAIFDSILPGSYKARAVMYYDGKSVALEQEFDYGKWVIGIKDIRVDNFTLGDFVEFDITLQNNWNEDAVDVIADLIVTDEGTYNYKSVTSFTTIPTYESGHIKAYWDTQDIAPGDYYLNMDVYYADRKEHYVEKVTVEDKRIITKYYAPPEHVTVSFYKKMVPEKHRILITNFAYPAIILVMILLTFTLLIQALPFIESYISKISLKKPIKIMQNLIRYIGSHMPQPDFIEKLKRKKRIRKLKKLKKKCMRAIASAREDALTMRKAVNGIYYELEKRKISKKEFDKRLLTILEEKPLIWWENHYAKLIIKLEDNIKEINKKIWEEGSCY